MPSSESPVAAHPPATPVSGKIVVIMGSTSRRGLDTAGPLLNMGASLIIFACRNRPMEQAEVYAYKPSTMRVPALVSSSDASPVTENPHVEVMALNMEDFKSVKSFCKRLKRRVPHIDCLLLSAGVFFRSYEKGCSGHERTTQVNYLSNVVLIAKLLPMLEKSAESTGSAARITWIGSRAHDLYELGFKPYQPKSYFRVNPPIGSWESVLGYFDDPETFTAAERYSDTKLLCVMFMYELAPLLDANKCVINMLCPTQENPNVGGDAILNCRYSNDPEFIAGLALNALLFAGPESHGQILKDRKIMSQVTLLCRDELTSLIYLPVY
ncbi:MAG: hypothetical protein Q9182_001103 [Xanthomendoza sp. 2 TL-2023]